MARTSPIGRTTSNLDPNYKNVFGQPLLRMTFDWQENDIKMAQFMFDKMAPIAKAMKPKYILGSPKTPTATLIPPPTRPPI